MEWASTSDLKDILIFGEAESSPRNVVYKIQGNFIDGDYKIAIQATNHTDEGTFVTSFTLKALQDYYFEALDLAPTSEKMALHWITEGFGYRSQDVKGLVSWENSARPSLIAKYRVIEANSNVDLILPPDTSPFVGSLPPKLVSDVRASITVSAIRKEIATCKKLAECEAGKVAYTSAMHAGYTETENPRGMEAVQDILDLLHNNPVKPPTSADPGWTYGQHSYLTSTEASTKVKHTPGKMDEGEAKLQGKTSTEPQRRIGAPVIIPGKNRKRQQGLHNGFEGRSPPHPPPFPKK